MDSGRQVSSEVVFEVFEDPHTGWTLKPMKQRLEASIDDPQVALCCVSNQRHIGRAQTDDLIEDLNRVLACANGRCVPEGVELVDALGKCELHTGCGTESLHLIVELLLCDSCL